MGVATEADVGVDLGAVGVNPPFPVTMDFAEHLWSPECFSAAPLTSYSVAEPNIVDLAVFEVLLSLLIAFNSAAHFVDCSL